MLDVTPMAGERPTGIGNYTRWLLEELVKIDGLVIEGRWRPGGSRREAHLEPLMPPSIAARRWLSPISDLNLRGFDIYHGTDSRIPERGRFIKIVTVHDLAVYEPGLLEETFARQGRERFETMLRRCRPDRILAISEFTRGRLVEQFPALDPIIRVVPLGVGSPSSPVPPFVLERGSGGVPDSSSIPHPSSFLLAPGTIERRKNQAATVGAFEIIKQRFPEMRLVVAGGEGFDSHTVLEAIERSPVRDSIIRPGYVSDDELARLYGTAAATIYPSLYEGFGLPILEAMAAGSPVVTSDHGAMLETAGDAALHADPADPESIAAAVIRLLDDESLRASLVRAGLDRAAYFSWKRCAERTAEVYRECVG